MYLGELTRLILLDVIDQGILFSGMTNRGRLNEKGSFPTWFVSQVGIQNSCTKLLFKNITFRRQDLMPLTNFDLGYGCSSGYG